MWNFQRIICIWICCVSCMFGTTQLSALVQAVPYEYFDDHDQSFYDLDTEQIQAKYDTRLLSQQILDTEQQSKYLDNKNLFKTTITARGEDDVKNSLATKEHPLYISTKLKSNDDGHTTNIRPDDDDETATVTATSSSAITDKVEELYLPRAASCYTNGQKYTHGQKVPRLDSCEVCLCMDGEIFCWWEKCDKKPATLPVTYDDYSTPYEESSTTRIQPTNTKSIYKTTLKPKEKSKVTVNIDYKYDDEDSTELREMQQEYEGLKEKLMTQQKQQHNKIHNKQMVKKKIYQQQEEKKHNLKIKEQQNEKKLKEEQPFKRQHKNNEHAGQQHQHHMHNHNHDSYDSSSKGANKILNFPENLPSVLYYDYKTEEHHQHQHQHHEQHLKHQKQQQHEKELKHRQQQQQLEQKQQQQKQKHHHINRHHEYGQDFTRYNTDDEMASAASTPTWLHMIEGGHDGSSTFKYYSSNGNDNIHNNNVDLPTDSDILPEPPTKKTKLTAATSVTSTTTPASYHMSSSTLTTSSSSSTASITARPLKKQLFSPWDYGKPNRNKVNNKNNYNNNESTEDSDNQDDAFHRWLTSTETNNKNNFSLNGNVDGSGRSVAKVASDYNMDDKNYENIDIDIETGTGALPPLTMQLTTATTKTTATATQVLNANITKTTAGRETDMVGGYGEDIKTNRNFVNSRTSKYEQQQHYADNKGNNNNYNSNDNILEENLNIENSNGNNNISPFSNPYQNYNDNNRQIINPSRSSSSSSSRIINESASSSSASNEDNGVASVVNIDILLTASSSAEQQQQPDPLLNVEKTTQPQEQLQDFEHEKQISSLKQVKFVPAPSVLISNTNDASLDNNKLLSSITNDNSDNIKARTTTTNIAGGGPNVKPPKSMGVNLLSNSNSNINSSTTVTSNLNNSSSGSSRATSSTSATSSQQIINDSYNFNNLSTVSVSTATNFVDADVGALATTTSTTTATPALNTTLSPERLCNVMGTLYRIGDVLPQDTGNCLQCICIDGSTSDDTPRVTCSPHNCPPLVLPDLFDATGY